jgi:predicted AAA+ superfamily ATPase
MMPSTQARVAVLEGTAHATGQAWKHGKQTIKTLWGELARRAELDGQGHLSTLEDGKAAAGAMAFWANTLQYLYLPRLKSRDSLSQAIRTGAASTDFFGAAYGQEGDKNTGFQSR